MTRALATAGLLALASIAGDRAGCAGPGRRPRRRPSAAKAKELVALLQGKKLEAFAVRDPIQPGRYVAVLLVPGVQLLVVSAVVRPRVGHGLPLLPQGLPERVPGPAARRAVQGQGVRRGRGAPTAWWRCRARTRARRGDAWATAQQTFNGDFVGPETQEPAARFQEDYLKAFATADMRSTRACSDLLIAGLKKA